MDQPEILENDPSIIAMNMITQTSTKYIELKRLEAKAYKLQLQLQVADIIHPHYLDLKFEDLKEIKKFMELVTNNMEKIKLKLQCSTVQDHIEIEQKYQWFVHKFFEEIVPVVNHWDNLYQNLEWAQKLNLDKAEKLMDSLHKITILRLKDFHETVDKVKKVNAKLSQQCEEKNCDLQ